MADGCLALCHWKVDGELREKVRVRLLGDGEWGRGGLVGAGLVGVIG